MTNAIIQPQNQAKSPPAGAHQKSGGQSLKSLAAEAFPSLHMYIGTSQMQALLDGIFGEEGEFLLLKIMALAQIIRDMPKTYETTGQGDAAVCSLHYFFRGCDWYIIEKDVETEENQAFGLCRLGHGEPEFGYISLPEILSAGAEIDLYFEPTPVATIAKKLKGI